MSQDLGLRVQGLGFRITMEPVPAHLIGLQRQVPYGGTIGGLVALGFVMCTCGLPFSLPQTVFAAIVPPGASSNVPLTMYTLNVQVLCHFDSNPLAQTD